MYRFANLLVGDPLGLPLGMGFFPEVVLLPGLMALADGLVLAWVLVELRNALLGEMAEVRTVREAVGLWPAAVLACLGALPARYVAPGAWLFTVDLPTWTASIRGVLAALILGWGLVLVQGAALITMGLVGAAAWSGGGPAAACRRYQDMLRAEGGRLVAALAVSGLAAGVLTALAHALVLALPRQPWVLAAADSYAHYATLVVGLITASAFVELGQRALPHAVADDGCLMANA